MVPRTYNNFTPGVQQDDFLTNGPNFIEHKNIDGLRDGYGVTLGPKINKQLTTGLKSMLAIAFKQENDGSFTDSLIGGEDGKLYYMDSVDDTPEHTLVQDGAGFTGVDVDIINIEILGSTYYIFYKQNYDVSAIGCATVSLFDARTGNWAGIVDEYIRSGIGLANTGIPPMVKFNNAIYVGSSTSIVKVDASFTPGASNLPAANNFGFPSDQVVGLTLQGSTVVVYLRTGLIYFWDGEDTTYQAIKNLKTRISKVVSKWGIDHITTEDGQFYIGSGLSFQRVTKPKLSKRMEDNTSFNKRLSFSIDEPNNAQNRVMQVALDDVYMYSSDTIKGLYKYGTLIPGMQAGLHKIMTQNHAGTQIDYIYDMVFYERELRRLYISYKAGTTYGIDYIDLDSLETCSDGYMVSEVFSGGTSLKKEISKLRRATSNTAGNNYIKLYYRVNNKSWVLIRNINDATNEIERENLNRDATQSSYSQFIDIQLKIEFHNDTGSEDAPTLHEIMQEYDAIET